MSINIRYLPNEEKSRIRLLYETTFEDSKEYTDYLFEGPIYEHDVLVLESHEEICSMLQLVPKRMVCNGEVYTVHYIYAVATAEKERKKGYMGMLLERAFEDLKAKKEPWTYLVPVDPKVYKKFGFRVVYLKPKYKYREEPAQIRVYHPNKMDSVILQKFCNRLLQAKYDTYLFHDEAYFDKLFKELEIEKGYLIYHTNGERLSGYSLVASNGTIIETMFSEEPKEMILNGFTPWIMVKELRNDCKVGRVCINDET